jgi:predicted Ser/Thr protein kinase
MIPRLPKGLSLPVSIGSGAFASVYRARQSGIDRWVAVKIIHEKDRTRRRELLQEAKVQSRINLGCIPRVFDAFAWGQAICIIMEWIKGVPLSTLLTATLDGEERIILATRFIEAVAGLHALNFAHRDLKPENVLVTPDCRTYLVDFGFSRNIADNRNSLACIAKGTPAYMAPEVWEKGAQVDLIRADVFSAGKVLLEILGKEAESDIVKKCLLAHPGSRLPSGTALLDEWKSSRRVSVATHDCPIAAAASLSAELLADRLVHAAKQLMYAHRNDEAYWLLVEALEENPEHGEAVQLMADFSRFSQKQRIGSGIRWSAAAATAFAVALAAFFAGRQSGIRETVVESVRMNVTEGRIIMADHRELRDPGTFAFKESRFAASGLTGRVIVANAPRNGSLYLDNKAIDDRNAAVSGMDLAYGRYTLAWHDDKNIPRWKERFMLLPFETKVVPVTTGVR